MLSADIKAVLSACLFRGGFLIVPEIVEFWQGHSDRLHDRLRYKRVKPLPLPLPCGVSTEDSQWTVERLSP
jgi:pyridoxamine 5'-phosphate oxidase